jgi:hypothetical protein
VHVEWFLEGAVPLKVVESQDQSIFGGGILVDMPGSLLKGVIYIRGPLTLPSAQSII